MEYRKDLDGLRAIAVLPVIFFHAGFNTFKGGFLGVDVFFVISGFLITSIVLHELRDGKFSIAHFYERRARRILPALFFVLTCTSMAGYVFMPPFEFKEFSQSLVSVVAFVSNIFFYFEIDYFSLLAEEMPLLHTWSLAIEEQYYIIFPPVLFVLWRFGYKHTFIALCFFLSSSFVVMLLLNYYSYNSASFYWPVSRAWELLAGSLCALIVFKEKLINASHFSDIGLLLLIGCIFVWSDDFSHPGALTVIPVFATCLIVLFPNKKNLSYKILSNNEVVFIGMISYSLYLWHQPVFAFIRMKTVGEPGDFLVAMAIIFIFIAAYFSYLYIEKPFRNRKSFSRKFIFISSISGLSFFLIYGVYGNYSDGVSERFSSIKSYSSSIKNSPKRESCHSSKANYLSPGDVCIYFGNDPTWAVFGDSHTVEPAYALANLLKQKNIGLSHHSYSGCPPALNYQLKGKELCTKWLNEHLHYLEENNVIKNVLVGFRYSAAIYGDNITLYPNVPNQVLMDNVVTDENLSDQEKLELYWDSLKEIIERLLASGKKVLLLDPIPELPMHIGRGVTPFSIYGDRTLLDLTTATSKEYYDQRHEFILNRLQSLPANENLTRISVYDLLCHEKGCPAVIQDSAIYFDDDHLSVIGSTILLKRLEDSIGFL